MIQIRPVSDLRNKYPEIEELVLKENEAVYLTKNGYGSMVVMSLEKYSNLIKEIELERAIDFRFANNNIEKALDISEELLDNTNTKYLNHDEVFTKARRIISDKK